MLDRLNRLYFNINNFFDNNLTKEDYIRVKSMYYDKLSEERIEILDLIYGVNGRCYTIKELAELYKVDYIVMHDKVRHARNFVISLCYKRNNRLEFDKDIYIPYLDIIDFTEEHKKILVMYLIEGKGYDEIAKEVKKRGASLMNILPLIPLAKMKHYSRPDCSMMESVREQVEEIIPVFRACTQCRADAYGIPGKKSEDHHLGMTPQSHY